MTAEADPSTTQHRARSDDSTATPVVVAIAIFVSAFALRILAARLFAGEPVWDGHYYDFGARRIAEGHGYSDDRLVGGRLEWHPWCHYPVGYSAYLALFYWLLGSHAWVAHAANGLTGALVCVSVYLLAREGLSERRARLAGALATLHPGLILYGALVMGELLSALTVMSAFWIAIRGSRVAALRADADGAREAAPSRRPIVATLLSMRGVAAGALVLGAGALVRPQALLCAPFLALALPLAARTPASRAAWARRWTPRALAAVVACGLALAPVLPWTARNCRVMDGCALVSTNAGWNLAIGSFPRATGRFETLRSSDGCSEVTGQVQQDRCWLEYGIANIRRAPARWLALIPAKLSNTFDHESFAVEYLREARPTEWPEPRRVAWRSVLTSVHRILIMASPLAFVALILPRRRGRPVQVGLLAAIALASYLGVAADTPTFWPIVLGACLLAWLPLPGRPAIPAALLLPVALIATTAVTHAVFFGDDRYHLVVTPALCLLAAAALRAPNTRGADTRGARAAGTSSS